MPEGDALRRAAQRLQVLAGQRVEVETPHPRAAAKGLVERLDGRTLESVVAVGKNLVLRFEGGFVLRSHLRMTGRWRVERRGTLRSGRPWLVLRGDEHEAVLWNGPVLELGRDARRLAHLGPDILSGIGNTWKAESLWEARVSPWRLLAEVSDDGLRDVLGAANRLMRASVEGVPPQRHVYRRAGRGCPRCGTAIRSHPQGEAARTAHWCPGCQQGGSEPPR